MKTIGEVLKSRRERLGMTLSELEQRTQLKRQTLIHIENNDFNELAKSDYTEGFIRKYAKVVNIEPNQLIEAHQDEIPETQYQICLLYHISEPTRLMCLSRMPSSA